MTELELYKFVTNNKLEYYWFDGDLTLWIPFYLMDKFIALFEGDHYLFEDGDPNVLLSPVSVGMKDMIDICEYYDIDPKKIFHAKGWDYHSEI